MKLHEFHEYIKEMEGKQKDCNEINNFQEELGSLEGPENFSIYPIEDLASSADEADTLRGVASLVGRVNWHIESIKAMEHIGHKMDALGEMLGEISIALLVAKK